MRIERPQTPRKVMHKGKLVYRVGHAQMMTLRLLDALGRTEAPPKGIVTPTGVIREHVARDMFPQGFVDMHRARVGVVDYVVTKIGQEVLREGIVADKPKSAKAKKEAKRAEQLLAKLQRQARKPKPASLLAKQRSKAKAAKAKGQGGPSVAANGSAHEPRVAARRA